MALADSMLEAIQIKFFFAIKYYFFGYFSYNQRLLNPLRNVYICSFSLIKNKINILKLIFDI